MPAVLPAYETLLARSGDPFWAATRALTVKWATSIEWPGRVLELGGQNGVVSSLMDRRIDLMIDTKPGVTVPVYGEVRVGSSEHLDLPDSSFDTIIALNMIYHTHRERSLSECHRVLTKDGLLVVTDSPGWGDIITWPYLLTRAGLHEMAEQWREAENRYHENMTVVPVEWWDNLPGWEVIVRGTFASLSLCRMTRAFHTLKNLLGRLRAPEVDGIIDQAYRLALPTMDKTPEYLARDAEMCAKEGGAFLFLALRKI